MCDTPNNSGTLNIPLIAKDPEYSITGKRTTAYPDKNNIEVNVLVVKSKRLAKKPGIVVSPPFK